MIQLLDLLQAWTTGEHAGRDESVKIHYTRGRLDVAKQSSSVSFESSSKLGIVAVWESGEVEAEVIEVASTRRVYVYSGVVDDQDELLVVLDETLQAVQNHGPTETGTTGAW